jgi:aryl-alcohol dehydrogenase-like predicted oxidoreductase
MQYCTLGSTGIRVSRIAFGAGPVSGLLTAENSQAQLRTVERAIELGVNWFDTAATYGGGQSEANLGQTLAQLKAHNAHVATKVRIMPDQLADIPGAMRASIEGSLKRLQRERVDLLQIHNSITATAGAQPTSLSPAHVLAPGGLLEQMQKLKQQGLVAHLGLTGLGEPAALREVIETGELETIQIPFNLLNPSAGQQVPNAYAEANYGDLISYCGRRQMGVFAIRVYSGGALLGSEPSPYTYQTKFFPLDLYERDRRNAARLAELLPADISLQEAALRFVFTQPSVTSAIVGFGQPEHVDAALRAAERGPLAAELTADLLEHILQPTATR